MTEQISPPRDPRTRRRQGSARYLVSDPYQADPDEFEVIRVRSTERSTYISLLVLLGVLGVFFFGVWQVVQWGREQLDPPGEQGPEVVLTLDDGATASSISSDLADASIIPNAMAYEWYVRLKGEGITFQAGDYTFRENSAAWEVLDALRAGPTSVRQRVQVRFTIPEGSTIREIAARLDSSGDLPFTGAQFLVALSQGDHSSDLLPEATPDGARERMEGMLFPDTYFIDEEAGTPADLIAQQISRTEQVAEELDLARRAAVIGLTPYEALIVASLVEKEARIDADRGPIARVILNRLAAEMELGIDATVIYITGDTVITVSDLATVSPYNTRLAGNLGLPPTPIASPGRSSIEAVLNAPEGDWLYYVRTEPDGGHTFTVTEREFAEAKQLCIDRGFCS